MIKILHIFSDITGFIVLTVSKEDYDSFTNYIEDKIGNRYEKKISLTTWIGYESIYG